MGGRAPVVVCGIEDALADNAVVAFAAELVRRVNGRLVLVHVQPPPLLAVEPQVAYAARNPDTGRSLRMAALTLARNAAAAGLAPSTKLHVGYGDLENRLLAIAQREAAALIVVDSLAASSSGCSGSLVPRLIERATCPLIVLPSHRAFRACPVGDDWGHEPIAAACAGHDAVSVSSDGGESESSSIVCGVDGSRDAYVALRVAAHLSKRLGVRLVAAHVVQPPVPSRGFGPTARQLATIPGDALLAGGETLVERMLQDEELGATDRRVVLGFPADRLADVADEEHAELIVVGSRGRGAFKAAFLGSVSTDVIGVARCPVLIVPPATRTAES